MKFDLCSFLSPCSDPRGCISRLLQNQNTCLSGSNIDPDRFFLHDVFDLFPCQFPYLPQPSFPLLTPVVDGVCPHSNASPFGKFDSYREMDSCRGWQTDVPDVLMTTQLENPIGGGEIYGQFRLSKSIRDVVIWFRGAFWTLVPFNWLIFESGWCGFDSIGINIVLNFCGWIHQ
ncbi:hypothetical protein HNY73_012014 [Argiope bruennichi]|uniref:Uncharacterized protein n=1 Tax=Argiope bruennichi TaxID=94029 RepID=A0A8T0ETK7_ARGBR|nr:hypothetical protein HNY73_012014 [Argiope bruennichi]